jgi:hypothetical protein
MKRVALIALILSGIAVAQTISPVNSEHSRKKIRTEFSLSNDGFTPLSVTLEPMSLTIVDGKPVVAELAADTHVKLSEYSARIGAKQIHTFAVDASCPSNCAFIVFTTFVTGHTDDGVAIATHLGTTMYACDRAKNCRQSFLSQLK